MTGRRASPVNLPSVAERFEQKFIRDSSGCWLWTDTPTYDGYGRFWVSRTNQPRLIHAHRWSFEHYKGPVPVGMVLDHLCRVRHCVNPEHLEIVTNRENALRGNGWSGRNARKTECVNGHSLTGINLVSSIRGGGQHVGRKCRICRNEHNRQYMERRRTRTADEVEADRLAGIRWIRCLRCNQPARYAKANLCESCALSRGICSDCGKAKRPTDSKRCRSCAARLARLNRRAVARKFGHTDLLSAKGNDSRS